MRLSGTVGLLSSFAKLDAIKQPSMTQPHANIALPANLRENWRMRCFSQRRSITAYPIRRIPRRSRVAQYGPPRCEGNYRGIFEKSGLWEAFSTNALTSIVEGDKESCLVSARNILIPSDTWSGTKKPFLCIDGYRARLSLSKAQRTIRRCL
jgi:hypothetical protein